MNILPLVLALVLILSVLVVEKVEKIKNQAIIQREYQVFLKQSERQAFNRHQQRLFGINQKNVRQLSFRFIVDKKAREKHPNSAKQYRLLIAELIKIVYGEAAFFKNLEKKRPQFLEEMLTVIEKVAENATIKRVQDISRLDLGDLELQAAFYHMLKGTVSREQLKEMKKDLTPQEKSYVSLFNFINYNGKENPPRIVIQRAPREIIKAIFVNDDIVDTILLRRNELAQNSGSAKDFENEFKDKRRPEIEDQLLDFSISSTDKTEYD